MKENKKERVVFAMPSFNIGGIEKHTLNLLRRLDVSRNEYHLITLFHRPHKPDLYGELPEYVRTHKFNFNGMFDLFEIWRLFRKIRKINPDVVVTSMTPANNLFRTLKPFFKYKVVAREHNIYTDKKWWHFVLDHIFSYWTEKIIAVSDEVAKFASKKAKILRDKFVVINNGVDLEKITSYIKSSGSRDEILDKLGLDKKFKYIINVARLKPQKNHKLLIDSFKIFRENNPQYKLLILGDGQSRKELDDYILENGLRDAVLLCGYRSDVFDFYLVSEFFVLTSEREGFPNVVVEALAFGLPVLMTPVSGSKELIKQGYNGYIVERNKLLFTERMNDFANISEEEKQKFKLACKNTAKKFDIKEIAEKYENLISEIIYE